MLEKPDVPDEDIISRLQEAYGLQVLHLDFLPLGADVGTAVYRVVTDDGMAYFLKLRKGFEAITVTVPLFLKSQGLQEIIAPVETRSKQGWLNFGEYTLILYPFIEGKNGFETDLKAEHRQALGAALRQIHSAQLPAELRSLLPIETFDPRWRNILQGLQHLVETDPFDDPAGASLSEFMKLKQREIRFLVERTEQLASKLQSQTLEYVLCHSDVHGGNMLVSDQGGFYIVDWDNPILAPRERDLMFIGGGIDNLWEGTIRRQADFFHGYGKVQRNMTAMAYYRYERIIEDLAVIGEQLLLTSEGGADRQRSLGWFSSNFEPRGTIHIARVTDRLSRIDH
jgi:spectinomycin phosphotransferase